MTLPSKSIVVTGFEPYGGRRINPAAEVAKALDAQSIDGFAATLTNRSRCVTP